LVKLSDFNPKIEMRLLMRKKILVLTVILMVALAACQNAAESPITSPTVETGVSGDTPSPVESPTVEIAPTDTQEEPVKQVENPEVANCTVVSRQPTPGPTEQSLVPAVSDSDWTHGPEDAKVTIIEYGDFQ
jgi:hypothetical protein